MKFYALLFSLVFVLGGKAQQDSIRSPYREIILEQLFTEYDVENVSDTSYARILRLSIQDAEKMDSLFLEVSYPDDPSFSAGSKLISKNDFLETPCKAKFCAYTNQDNELVIYLGKYSFTRKYHLKLNFMKHPEFNWEKDF